MSKPYEALRGMEDILPGEVEKWQWIEEKARIYFEANGFKEIRTPLLELTDLFVRTVGESSDIVHKEMFSFEDRGGRNITLRPEMTASVARAVIEKGLLRQAKSLRLYYLGPMFRAERPQAGRKRQFHQIGIEIVNEAGVSADFEAVSLLNGFLKYSGIKEYEFVINDLGSFEQQQKFKSDLKKYFDKNKHLLCPDCLWRLEKNVLRIFDCKNESCQPVIMASTWEQIRNEEWEKIREQMMAHGIPHKINARLVRGLDYYNGMVFEVRSKSLGAQDAIAGGGRYDRLYQALGGEPTPCTGFSIGMERLLTVLEKGEEDLAGQIGSRKVYLAPLDSRCEVLGLCQKAALELRARGIRIETLAGESAISKHLKKANQLGIRFVLILGADEFQKGKWTVKDMNEKKQTEVEGERLASYLTEVLGS